MDFLADDRVRKSAILQKKMCTEMNDITQEVLGLCSKDLIQVKKNIMPPVIKSLCGSSTNQKNQRILV